MGRIIPLDPKDPEPEVVRLVVRTLARGEVIAAPSDTVYGFLGRADSPAAWDAMRRLKSREGPFVHLIQGVESLETWAAPLDPGLRKALERVWPGPVTVVLPVKDSASGIAFRVPRSPWLFRLLAAAAGPLLSTSANLRGEPPPRSAGELVSRFPALPLIIDGGIAPVARPSTLVDARNRPYMVLREGSGDATPLVGAF